MPAVEEHELSVRKRRAARVILIDHTGRVLLFRGGDPSRPEAGTWWFTPGGGVDGNESIEDAARREVREETGLVLTELGPIVLSRRIEFEFEGVLNDQDEDFFAVTVAGFEIDDREWTDLERRTVLEHRWWTLAELAATTETAYPEGLVELVLALREERAQDYQTGIVRAVTASVEVIEAGIAEKAVLSRLLELYQHDFSEFEGADVGSDGLYGYRYLDNYWTEPERHPFLFRVDGHWAGFALVCAGTPHDMAEFFVMRKYRRHGVGREAARAVFRHFPGEWQVRQERTNAAATLFWRRAIPVAFEEGVTDAGPVQRFSIE